MQEVLASRVITHKTFGNCEAYSMKQITKRLDNSSMLHQEDSILQVQSTLQARIVIVQEAIKNYENTIKRVDTIIKLLQQEITTEQTAFNNAKNGANELNQRITQKQNEIDTVSFKISESRTNISRWTSTTARIGFRDMDGTFKYFTSKTQLQNYTTNLVDILENKKKGMPKLKKQLSSNQNMINKYNSLQNNLQDAIKERSSLRQQLDDENTKLDNENVKLDNENVKLEKFRASDYYFWKNCQKTRKDMPKIVLQSPDIPASGEITMN